MFHEKKQCIMKKISLAEANKAKQQLGLSCSVNEIMSGFTIRTTDEEFDALERRMRFVEW